ncbi:MAG TPA: hypothetical protein VFX65_13335 [Candidatus Limnocylindrales bacterium]|nr:hypothetical protein [Candidatus Limnocylindrales bacterium]
MITHRSGDMARVLLMLALGLTPTACATAGPSTSPSPSPAPSPTPEVTAAPRATARPSPTVAPAPTYPANVMDVPDFSPLEVETYFVDPVSTEMRVFYTIPADGWMSWFGAFKVGEGTVDPLPVVGLSIINVTNVAQDGCTAQVAADPPVGPTVDDMATALAALEPFELTKPPTAVTAFGFSGKHLELTVPDIAFEATEDDTNFTDCTNGELSSWIGAPLGFAYYGYSHPGQAEEIWLLDVDGQRLMIVAGTSPGSSEGDIAQLRSILESIEIVP